MTSPVVAEIYRQLISQGINRRLTFVQWDENTLKVSRGEDGSLIKYNAATDLYDVTEYHSFDRLPEVRGIYAAQLLDVIMPSFTPREGYGSERRNPLAESLAGGLAAGAAAGAAAGYVGSKMRNPSSGGLSQDAFDAAKDFRLSGAYSETGVANARVAKYGFSKWYNSHTKQELRGKRKSSLLKAWMEGWAAGKRIEKKGNPESSAADLSVSFHGRDPEEITEYVDEVHEHEWYTGLGDLVELKVRTLTDLDATIQFEEGEDRPKLCSSEDGRQLYIIGGDHSLDLAALKMSGEKWEKDLMTIGVLYELTYRTEKGFDSFKLTDYFHDLGEESGVQPMLLYDARNQSLSVAGGQYQVKKEGIVN